MKNLFKKICMVVAALFLSVALNPSMTSAADDDDGWVHSQKPWDYKNGLFDDPYFLQNIEHDLDSRLIDNINQLSLKTGGGINGDLNAKYELKSKIPFDVTGIYVDGAGAFNNSFLKVKFSDGTEKSYDRRDNGYNDLNLSGVLSIEFFMPNGANAKGIRQLDIFGAYKKEKYPPVIVESIKANVNSIDVTFKKPDEAQAVDVWLNNQKISRTEDETYTYVNLEPDTEYELMFVNYYGDDNYGAAVRETVRTKKETVGEVSDLVATATSHEQVNLNWSNPNQSNFSHVTIYRDEVKKQGILNKLNFFMVAHAAEPTKLFETNGTYFIDHSVMASTSYEYLVTTTDDTGKESMGVSQTVQTLKKPNPDPPVSEMEKDENGDYRVTWTSPKEGKVLIRVGGKDYATVNATQGSFLIPGADMVYSVFGSPRVQVLAIDLDGDTSKGNSPGAPGSTGDNGDNGGSGGSVGLEDIKLPFTSSDLLNHVISFIGTLDRLIILVLAIILTPIFIRIIKPIMMQDYEKRKEK